MGQVYDMEKEIISEQSKKEICQAVKERAKDYLTEEQLEEFDNIFYSVADKYIFGAKKKEWKFKRPLAIQQNLYKEIVFTLYGRNYLFMIANWLKRKNVNDIMYENKNHFKRYI